MLKKSYCYFLLFCFLSNFLYSQAIAIKISCKVVDLKTKQPIVYATVMLKKINRGTHADHNGNFEIPIKYQQKGMIRISSIGYTTKEVKLSDLTKNSVHMIYLSKSNNVLDEVIVKTSKKKKRRLLAKQIVKRAIDNILANYATEPHAYIGYYRDYQQPVGNSYQKNTNAKEPIQYINVHEAIIESFDAGFDSNKLTSRKNQTLLYKYKANKKFIQDTTLTIPYDNSSKKYSESVYITPLGGNELNILNLTNPIRNHAKMSFSYVNVMEKNFLKNHRFKVKKVVFTDDIPLYEISFFSIKDQTSYDYSADGSIFISKKDFAIHKLNYNLYYIRDTNPQYSVTIEYRPQNDKMYLNYITFNNFFEATNGNYFKIDKTIFNSKRNIFKIYFSKTIDVSSLNPIRRNFKIYYKGEKLRIIDVIPSETDKRSVTVSIDKKSIAKIHFEKGKENPNYGAYFRFDITNIKDLNGFKIDKRPSIKMNQYREFFVQEVFENKKLPVQKTFINKSLPLDKSEITPLKLENNYWMNSPLKTSKEER
jgi:hypothetical protein